MLSWEVGKSYSHATRVGLIWLYIRTITFLSLLRKDMLRHQTYDQYFDHEYIFKISTLGRLYVWKTLECTLMCCRFNIQLSSLYITQTPLRFCYFNLVCSSPHRCLPNTLVHSQDNFRSKIYNKHVLPRVRLDFIKVLNDYI